MGLPLSLTGYSAKNMFCNKCLKEYYPQQAWIHEKCVANNPIPPVANKGSPDSLRVELWRQANRERYNARQKLLMRRRRASWSYAITRIIILRMGCVVSVRGRKKRSKDFTGSTTLPFSLSPLTPEARYRWRIQTMILCISEHDWHGVMDAAADIRELVAAHPELRKHEQKLWSNTTPKWPPLKA